MASVYELYLGGPRQQNTDWAIFPAAPFSSANTSNLAPPSKHPVVYGASRTLDFTNDKALSYFLKKNLVTGAVVNGDAFGAVVIPSNSLFFGLWYKVNSIIAGTGGTFKLRVRGAAADLIAGLDPHVTPTTGFATYPNATAVPGTIGAAAALLFHMFTTPDIVDLVVTALPTPNVWSAFSITLTPVFFNFQSGMMN
jgi:hypothetical protein